MAEQNTAVTEDMLVKKPATQGFEALSQIPYKAKHTPLESVTELYNDSLEVIGAGIVTGVHSVAKLGQDLVNEGASQLENPNIGGRDVFDAVNKIRGKSFEPVDTKPLLNIVPEDIRHFLRGAEDMSETKIQLAQSIAMVGTSIGLASKFNQIGKVDEIPKAFAQWRARTLNTVKADVLTGVVVADDHEDNLLSVFGVKQSDALGVFVSDASDSQARKEFNNMMVDTGTGLLLGTTLDSVMMLRKLVGSSTKSKTLRIEMLAELTGDPKYKATKEFVTKHVQGVSLMADAVQNTSKLDWGIKPLPPLPDSEAVKALQEVHRVDANNIKLKESKELRDLTSETTNQVKHVEHAKREALADLDEAEATLKAELHAENKAIQGDAPKPDQTGKSAKKSRDRYNKQVKAFDKQAGDRIDALELRRTKVVEEASHETELIGKTAVAKQEAITHKNSKILSDLDNKLSQDTDSVYGVTRQTEKLKQVDADIKAQKTDVEEVNVEYDTHNPKSAEPTVATSKAEKQVTNEKVKAQKVEIKSAIESNVINLRRALDDPSVDMTVSQQDIANKIIKRFDEGTLELDSAGIPKVGLSTRDEALDGVTHVLSFFGEEVNKVKKVINGDENLRYIDNVLNHGVTDKFTKSIDQLSTVTGLDKETLLINASAWGTVLEESTAVVMAFKLHIDEALGNFHGELKRISNRLGKLGDIDSSSITGEELDYLLKLKDEIEALYEGMGGVVSPSARTLRASGSAYGSKKFLDSLTTVRKNLNISKPSKEAVKNTRAKQSILDEAMKGLTVKDQRKLKQFIHDMAKMDLKDINASMVGKAMDTPAFNELLLTNGLLGMIASARTLNTVGVSTFFKYGYDQIITKNVDALISTIGRQVGLTDSQTRFDNIARIGAGLRVAKDYYQFFKGNKDALGSIGSTVSDYAERKVGHSIAESTELVAKSIGKRQGEGYDSLGSKAITKLQSKLEKPLAYSLFVNGKFAEAMGGIDGVYRRMVIEQEITSQAINAYHRGGGKAFYGDSMPASKFIERYRYKGREVMKLQDDLVDKKISQLELDEKMTELFKDDPNLLDSVLHATTEGETMALRTTFQETTDDTVTGQVLRTINHASSGDSYGAITGRFTIGMFLPFQKSPVNGLRSALEHSPFAVTTARFWDTLKHGTPEQKVNVLGKMVGGTTALWALSEFALEGRITGSLEVGEYGETLRTKRPPYSVRIGDKWVSYEKWGHLKYMLSGVADYMEYSSEEGNEEATWLTLWSMYLGSTMDDEVFKSTGEIIRAFDENDPEKAGKILTNKAITLLSPMKGALSTLDDLVFEHRVESSIEKEAIDIRSSLSRMLANSAKNTPYGSIIKATDEFSITNVYATQIDALGAQQSKYEGSWANRIMGLAGTKMVDLEQRPFMNQMLKSGVIQDTNNPVEIMGVGLNSVESKRFYTRLWQGDSVQEGFLSEAKRIIADPRFNELEPMQQDELLQGRKREYTDRLKMMMYASDEKLQQEATRLGQQKIRIGLSDVKLDDVPLELQNEFATLSTGSARYKQIANDVRKERKRTAGLQKEGKEVLKVLSK